MEKLLQMYVRKRSVTVDVNDSINNEVSADEFKTPEIKEEEEIFYKDAKGRGSNSHSISIDTGDGDEEIIQVQLEKSAHTKWDRKQASRGVRFLGRPFSVAPGGHGLVKPNEGFVLLTQSYKSINSRYKLGGTVDFKEEADSGDVLTQIQEEEESPELATSPVVNSFRELEEAFLEIERKGSFDSSSK
eukprot:TRINITY_DN1648_c0_g3_i2.p1 TRINITY_DN1648_c0_g3~~TRINITY_DN1648_c0_g3_i2.p1  ORF type:complete len:188 (+),score=51.88 TRINITY_DN1648_c0_g3_i2:524-1087(+)